MNFLISGGAGFIGSHLCRSALDRGHRVVCVDNFYLGSRANIAPLMDRPGFVFYESDVGDIEAAGRIFAAENIDQVFHLAANSDIRASGPRVEFDQTYATTFSLLENMRLHGVDKIFFASTGAVYGDRDGAPVGEDEGPFAPISYYGAAKLGAEALISAYCHMNGFSGLIFRFPNVIGPRLTHGVIYDFIGKLRQNPERLEILGDGRQAKPYLHVADLLAALWRFLDGPGGLRVYNVGVETLSTVTRIADLVCAALGLEGVAYEYAGGRGGWRGDVPVFAYNLAKIHQAGWRASLSSDEAVARSAMENIGDPPVGTEDAY